MPGPLSHRQFHTQLPPCRHTGALCRLHLTLPIHPVCGRQWPDAPGNTSLCAQWEKYEGNVTMADQWVRLGMALAIIALVSIGLYQFNARGTMAELTVIGVTDRH